MAQYTCSQAIARQQLGKHVAMAMNTHTTIEELLDAGVMLQRSATQKRYKIFLW
jgi:hypothetical protein